MYGTVFFLALMLPHGPGRVMVHEVRLVSVRRKKRAVRFLMDIYRRNKADGDDETKACK